MNTIFIIGIFITFFQFFLLLNKKNKSLPDKILAIWMLVISIHLISYSLHLNGYWDKYPHLIGLTAPFPLLYGPMLFLYTLYSLKYRRTLRKKDYLHFVPAILSYLYMLKFFFFYSVEEKRMVDTGKIDDFSTFSIFLLVAFIVSGITYSIFSYRFLRKHKRLINNNFSNTEQITLEWLKYLILGIGLIFSTATIIIVIRDFFGVHFHYNLDYIFYSMLIFGVLALGYFGIMHKNIFIDNIVYEHMEKEQKDEYKKSGLKDKDAENIHNKLLLLMSEQKPFLEPKLSLSSLARMLDISPNYLSQIINQHQQQNFNDFINKYRVGEFIERASKNTDYTILSHAFDVGFNSKSTFNTVFKKHKGITPSQYLSKHKSTQST